MPTPLLSEADRRDCARHAWEQVKRYPVPRKVRLLMRDALATRVQAALVAQRLQEQRATMARVGL